MTIVDEQHAIADENTSPPMVTPAPGLKEQFGKPSI
jgi:hypothetical protein